jgi:hypothetical protein
MAPENWQESYRLCGAERRTKQFGARQFLLVQGHRERRFVF